jgi:hypothetical protein
MHFVIDFIIKSFVLNTFECVVFLVNLFVKKESITI